jgi:hypothetical protein
MLPPKRMRRSFTGILALLAGAYAVHAQGTVSFANYLVLATYIYVGFAGPSSLLGGAASGPQPTLYNYRAEISNGYDWTVQLYGAVGENLPSSSLSPLAGATAHFATGAPIDSTAGTWFSTFFYEFPDAPNGTVATVQLYAWYNDGGTITSVAQAFADGVPVGSSSTGNVTLGAPPVAPAILPELGNFNMFIPEPSTLELGVMGASAFLMRLRRKDPS